MKTALPAVLSLVVLSAATSAWGADDAGLERMAICKDSWHDWQKDDPAKLKILGDHIRTGFAPKEGEPFLVPKSPVTIAGMRVSQLFPDSVGMGVGFSLTVDAPFDEARRRIAAAVGKPLAKCAASDDMRACELKISDIRTVTLMAEDSAKSTTTLVGCYYFYEK
jgi:hypothetical protein